jgi:uncharacterized protein
MRVTRLSVTPVKGLALHHPASIDVTAEGAVGDRVFYLVDHRDALLSIAKTGALVGVRADYDADENLLVLRAGDAVLASGVADLGEEVVADFFGFRSVAGRVVEGAFSAALSACAGRPVRLVRGTERLRGHDIAPLTMLGDASIAELARVAGVESVDGRRFRMLIEFDGAAAHAEDGWQNRRLRIGEAVVQVGGPVQRCAGTTRHPETGEVDFRTLQWIGEYRGRQQSIFGLGFNFGVYADCVVPGRVSVGDPLLAVD